MRRRSNALGLALVLFALVLWPTHPTAASSCGDKCASAETTATGLRGGIKQEIGSDTETRQSESTSASTSRHEGTYHQKPVCALGGAALCRQVQTCANGEVMQQSWYQTPNGAEDTSVWCPGMVDAPSPAIETLTTGRILQAFKTIKLPAAPLVIQPPNGKTLVNFRTVFYTTQQPFDRSIRLLGHRVDFRIKPSEYTFLFGDGHWLTTHEPGKPFTTVEALDGNITHKYLTKGTFHPSLNTTYGADFRVDGGAWRPVNGTVTIEGPKLALETLTATPVLVD